MTILNPNWCPLEATQYEGYCLDPHANIRSRVDLHCEHANECLQLKIKLDNHSLANPSTVILDRVQNKLL